MSAFLAWFGGTGYLLEQYYSVWFVVGAGRGHAERAGRRGDRVLFPRQGADAATTKNWTRPTTIWSACSASRSMQHSPIRHRRDDLILRPAPGARRRRASEDREPRFVKGMEVVVTRYESGVAYVRRVGRVGQSIVLSTNVNKEG